jgi:hypothetical protein
MSSQVIPTMPIRLPQTRRTIKRRWLEQLIERGPLFFSHYAHAAETRLFLIRELLRAQSQGIVVPRWLFRQALLRPGATEDLVNFLRFIRPDGQLRLIDVGANTGLWSAEFLRLRRSASVDSQCCCYTILGTSRDDGGNRKHAIEHS